MNCEFVSNNHGAWVCVKCKYQVYAASAEHECSFGKEIKTFVKVSRHQVSPKPKPRTKPHGPGSWLHYLIRRYFKKVPSTGCKCAARIRQMNAWGCDGCREHIDEIVGWLLEEADKMKFWSAAAMLPGSKFTLRQFIGTSIRLAEGSKKRRSRSGD